MEPPLCTNGSAGYLMQKVLTLKWSRPSALPLVVKGVVPMDPNSEKYFPE